LGRTGQRTKRGQHKFYRPLGILLEKRGGGSLKGIETPRSTNSGTLANHGVGPSLRPGAPGQKREEGRGKRCGPNRRNENGPWF